MFILSLRSETYVSETCISEMAVSETIISEIETAVGKEVGGYLTKLEDDYNIVTKHLPILTESSSKNVHYEIDDAFFRFWFRFIHKYNYMIEIGKYENLQKLIRRDYATFSGQALERYFRQKLAEEADITRIGSWWDHHTSKQFAEES